MLHWYCSFNYEGQFSYLYELMCRLGYEPSRLDRGDMEDEELDLYTQLQSREVDTEDLLSEIMEEV